MRHRGLRRTRTKDNNGGDDDDDGDTSPRLAWRRRSIRGWEDVGGERAPF
jgi:hypothetical protein